MSRILSSARSKMEDVLEIEKNLTMFQQSINSKKMKTMLNLINIIRFLTAT